MSAFYNELARWWPLLSPVEDYAEEAAEIERVLLEAAPDARTVLELGSGGGHNAYHLGRRFQLTLSDLSEPMLAVSRRLNPACAHHLGDMRTLELARTFDAVFIHDAIDYMATEPDLAAALATAYRHCRPGGLVLLLPDSQRETFEPDTDCGGSDAPSGEAIRYLEWTYDPDPTDDSIITIYTLVTREADGTIASVTERHHLGLFSHATWLRLLTEAGFGATSFPEVTSEARTPRTFFLGRRPE